MSRRPRPPNGSRTVVHSGLGPRGRLSRMYSWSHHHAGPHGQGSTSRCAGNRLPARSLATRSVRSHSGDLWVTRGSTTVSSRPPCATACATTDNGTEPASVSSRLTRDWLQPSNRARSRWLWPSLRRAERTANAIRVVRVRWLPSSVFMSTASLPLALCWGLPDHLWTARSRSAHGGEHWKHWRTLSSAGHLRGTGV